MSTLKERWKNDIPIPHVVNDEDLNYAERKELEKLRSRSPEQIKKDREKFLQLIEEMENAGSKKAG